MGRLARLLLVCIAVVSMACGGSGADRGSAARPTTTEVTGSGERDASASTAATTRSTAAGATGGSTTSAVTGEAVDVRAARPGNYVYDLEGTLSQGGKEQPFRSELTLHVGDLVGRDQLVTITPKGATKPNSSQTLRLERDGAYTREMELQTGPDQMTVLHPKGQALDTPWPPTVGRKWSWTLTSDDDSYTLTGTYSVVRTEVLTIGGEEVATAVIVGKTVTSAARGSTTTEITTWMADDLRLPVKQEARAGDERARQETHRILRSLTPS